MKETRNFFLVGAQGSGKTTFCEQVLADAGVIGRAGKVEDGNTVMDFTAQEIDQKSSINLSLAQFEWKGTKINLIDTPGNPDFVGEQMVSTKAAESAIIFANATAGFQAGLELAIGKLEVKPEICKAIVINKMDQKDADFDNVLQEIREHSNLSPAPICIPIGQGADFQGVVHLIKQKAYIDGNEVEIPAEMKDKVAEAFDILSEAVAQTSEEMLDIYLEKGELDQNQLLEGLKSGIREGLITPVFACSSVEDKAVRVTMDCLIRELPSPLDDNKIKVFKSGERTEIEASEDLPTLAYIFKSVSEGSVGTVCYVRVMCGVLKSGDTLHVPELGSKVKIGSMFVTVGKKRKEVHELVAGQLGVLVKLKDCQSLNTLTADSSLTVVPPDLPSPYVWRTIVPESQEDENKLGEVLEKVLQEDKTLHLDYNEMTRQSVLSGISLTQLSLIKKRLESAYNVKCDLLEPRVSYMETISKKAESHYRHKKQSGGRGQFAEVYFRISPMERGTGFKFISSIVGGVIPKGFIPAIEKGLKETIAKGIVAGYPVTDISVEVYDGSYHTVDSSEAAFKTAASMALKEGFVSASPVILEPIHIVEINIPSQYMGDVISDLSSRRGVVNGMSQKGKNQVIEALLPLSELFSYFPTLKSLTQGRGRFIQKFSHYQILQPDLAQKLMDEKDKE